MNRATRNKLVLFIMISLIVLMLTGCEPQSYNEDELNTLQSEGRQKVEEWFKSNNIDADLKECDVVETNYGTDPEPGALTDAVSGTFISDGKTHNYLFVTGTNKMYVDDLMEEAEEITGTMYGDGLGLKDYKIDKVEYLLFNIECTGYENNKNEDILEENSIEFISRAMIPFDVNENSIKDYLEKEYQNTDFGKDAKISLISEDDINVENLNLGYISNHPNHIIDIYNKDRSKRIRIGVDKTSYNEKFEGSGYINVTVSNHEKKTDNNGDEYMEYVIDSFYSYELNTLKLVEH